MSDTIFDSCPDDMARGNIDFDTDSFKAMIVTAAYVPNKATHAKRSDVTNEATGTGYAAGGTAVTATVAKDTVNHKVTVTFSNPSWPASTITGRAVVIYKSRGGLASADELVAYSDNGADCSSTNDTWTFTFSTPLTIANP